MKTMHHRAFRNAHTHITWRGPLFLSTFPGMVLAHLGAAGGGLAGITEEAALGLAVSDLQGGTGETER